MTIKNNTFIGKLEKLDLDQTIETRPFNANQMGLFGEKKELKLAKNNEIGRLCESVTQLEESFGSES
jgi:hypothetical protein